MKSFIETNMPTTTAPLIHLNIVVERDRYESLIARLPMPLTAIQTNDNEYNLFYDSEENS